MTESALPVRRGVLRFAATWVVLLGVAYAGVVVVFWFLERRLVFLPSSAAESWDQPVAAGTQDIALAAADGTRLHAWWLPPAVPEAGAVLLAHGNGGNLSHRGQLAADLHHTLGTGVLMFDYPGYGKSTGESSEAGCYTAGETAYRWLTDEAKITPGRVVLMGESLGGGTAVELATRHDHRALVLLFAFTSLPAAAKAHYPWLPTHTLMQTRFDNIAKLVRCQRPVFIVHGTADNVVPFAHGEALFASANEPKEFLRLKGVGHGLPPGDGFAVALAGFLTRHAP